MARLGKGLGVLGVVAALIGWHGSDRPDILIAKDGMLVGLLLPEGRALSKPNGGTFSARIWAQNDGRPMPREKSLCIVERSKRRPLSPLVEKNERIRNYLQPRKNAYFGAATPHKRGMLKPVSS
ncbi:hypothetical protein N9L08_03035 [Rhodobacteraceae bacterium]|nr:hypothetical protein [Paracoccaceae bacterium]